MKKEILLSAALIVMSVSTAYSANVSSWSELKANSNEANIEFQDNINATGEAYPMPINFSSSTPQTINGNYHSFSSDPYTGSGYYSLSINNTADLNIKNLGKYVDGTAGSNTFSYTDFNGNAKYVTIQGSVNSFDGYFLTIGKPITVNITNSVFANNGKDTNARLIYVSSSSTAGTLNVTDSVFYNNTMANAGPVINGNKFNVNVDNTIFYGNKNTPAAGSTQGGAIYTAGGKATITNSYFINNTAKNRASSSIKGQGGAIYISRGSGHIIENSRFEGNTSAEEGGAVYVYYNATTDYVKNSQFIGNTQTGAESYGGGGGLSFGGGYVRTI